MKRRVQKEAYAPLPPPRGAFEPEDASGIAAALDVAGFDARPRRSERDRRHREAERDRRCSIDICNERRPARGESA